jgi:hypothetical protein
MIQIPTLNSIFKFGRNNEVEICRKILEFLDSEISMEQAYSLTGSCNCVSMSELVNAYHFWITSYYLLESSQVKSFKFNTF